MPGFLELSAHLSAPQGLTRLTNVRFFDSWAFLGLTSLKCTLILAGRPGGGVWGGGTSPGRPGGSLSTHVHVSSQGHLGLMYRSCFDSGFGWFNLHRFLFTLSAKTIKTPRIWNFEVNFKNLTFVSLSAPGGWQVADKCIKHGICQLVSPKPCQTHWKLDSLILWFFDSLGWQGVHLSWQSVQP